MSRPVIHQGDVLDWAAAYQGEPFHAMLCDPPYHLTSMTERYGAPDAKPSGYGRDGAFNRLSKGFMGKQWDGGDLAFRPETWRAFWPLLHPGAFCMAFAGSRGWHRMAVAIEDAGYIIHPTMFLWCYSTGFPKATRIDTQIDAKGGASVGWFGPWLRQWRTERGINQKELAQHFPSKTGGLTGCVANWELGLNLPTVEQFNTLVRVLDLPFTSLAEAEREVLETRFDGGNRHVAILGTEAKDYDITAPATDLARAWAGHRYGLQALKPAVEPIIVFQKPYAGRPVDSITQTGAGALNIEAGRIGYSDSVNLDAVQDGNIYGNNGIYGQAEQRETTPTYKAGGRWPANLILQHAMLPVLALTAMIQSDVEQRIREYFDGYDRVSNLRKDRQENPHQSEVLQPRMPQRRQSRNGESPAGGDDVLVVQEVVSGSTVMGEGWAPKVLRQGVQDSAPVQPHRPKQSALWETEQPERQGTDEDGGTSAGIEPDISGRKASRLEGRDNDRQWVSVDDDQSTERSRSSVGATDETEGRVHSGAPAGDGSNARPPADQSGNRSSQERRQARQSSGEFGSARTGATFENPSGDDQGNCTAESGKPALEVLACDVPPEWRRYFELTGEDLGCEPIGERRVRTAWSQPTRGDKSGSDLFNVGNAQQGQEIGYADADGYETITAWRCVAGCAVAALGAQSGESVSPVGLSYRHASPNNSMSGPNTERGFSPNGHGDTGTAARFFYNADWQAERLEAADAVIYQAKASTAEREAGLSGRQKRAMEEISGGSGVNHPKADAYQARKSERFNSHPTLKPLSLCEHLARLLLPPALYAPRRLFQPFSGAGSEAIGAMRAGWEHVEGVELEPDHCDIARARIDYWAERGTQRGLFEGDE